MQKFSFQAFYRENLSFIHRVYALSEIFLFEQTFFFLTLSLCNSQQVLMPSSEIFTQLSTDRAYSFVLVVIDSVCRRKIKKNVTKCQFQIRDLSLEYERQRRICDVSNEFYNFIIKKLYKLISLKTSNLF